MTSISQIKPETKYQTAKEWLLEHFGPSALDIEGIDGWGKSTTISHASFVIAEGGRTFVSCGGTAIIALHRSHTVDKHPMYVVHDDSAGGVWELRQAAGTAPLHESRPHARLRLVMSA